VSFVYKFVFYVLSCLPWCQISIFRCHHISNPFAWVFKKPAENTVLRWGMFSSPPKPFELPPYASAIADCFTKAVSPRVRHFSRGTWNIFFVRKKGGWGEWYGMFSKPLVYHFGFGDYNSYLFLFSGFNKSCVLVLFLICGASLILSLHYFIFIISTRIAFFIYSSLFGSLNR
jgi:hypothetical protein